MIYLKVEVKIDETLEEIKIVIFTNKITNEVQEIINKLKSTQMKFILGQRIKKHTC